MLKYYMVKQYDPETVLKMIGFKVQGVPAVGYHEACSLLLPALDYLIGSFPPGGEFPCRFIFGVVAELNPLAGRSWF